MCDIIEVQDELAVASSLVDAIWMAAAHLPGEHCTPIREVADVASDKIKHVISGLDQIRGEEPQQSWLGLSEQCVRFDKWNPYQVQGAAICGSRLK